jgi:hypothetical protein
METFMNSLKQPFCKLLAAATLIVLWCAPAAAQDIKIGVVNVPVLMEQAPQAKVAMDALQEEFAPRQRHRYCVMWRVKMFYHHRMKKRPLNCKHRFPCRLKHIQF